MQLLNGHTEITFGIKFFTYLLMNDFLKKNFCRNCYKGNSKLEHKKKVGQPMDRVT